MERSNTSPKTESCPVEGQAPDLWYFRVERRRGSVLQEPLGPQAGVAPGLSHSASKPWKTADGDKVVHLEPNMAEAVQSEATDNLPGSQRVAPVERVDRNLGDPERARRTNYERPAGRESQRQEGSPGPDPGVGFVQRSPEQGHGPDLGQGTNLSTQPAQAPSPVRKTGQPWPTFLRAIADKAAQDKHHRFGDLYRHLNQDALRQSFYLLRKDAACGVDGVTFQEYEKDLEANLTDLVQRLKDKRYRTKLVLRKYIPKGPGKLRPLGILALEDKLVQCAVTQILVAIYEADFLPGSYGYRLNCSPHDAIRELTDALFWGKYNFIVEADIHGYFDHIRHEELLRMLAERIQDGAFLRLIRKWLRAGILEQDGQVIHPVLGTPQGGIVSPVLANVYLHYVLDQWFEQEVRKRHQGQCRLFRFADDFVTCFEYRHEAAAFEQKLKERLALYGLEVAPDKTKLLRFGRNGGTYNGRFDFLGFEFRWEADRKGRPTVKRRTSRKKLQASVRRFGEWIKTHRSEKLRKLMETLRSKFQGYWNYYGLIGNRDSLDHFWLLAKQLLYKWLNRRSQKPSYTWRTFQRLLKRFQVPPPRIVENSRSQRALPCCWDWKVGRLLGRSLFMKPV